MKIRDCIKKHCWNCEYFFEDDNVCKFSNKEIKKSKNSVCKKWKLVKILR